MRTSISARAVTWLVRLAALTMLVFAGAGGLMLGGNEAVAQPGVLRVSAGGPYSGQVGEPVFFMASVDFGGRPPTTAITFRWSYGDGTIETGGQVATHAYSQPGVYSLSVTLILLASGETATDSTTVTITGGQTPGQLTVSAGGPYTGQAGQPITMTAQVNLGGRPPNTPFDVEWDFGDGTRGIGPVIEKTYNQPGTFTVTVTVNVLAGFQSASNSTTAFVRPATAQISASAGGPYTGTAGQPITMTGSISPPGLAVQAWLWNFGDGTSGSGQTVQKTYTQPGTYTVTLQVRPANEGAVTVTTVATVSAAQQQEDRVPLPPGCSNQALTWPVGTPMSTVANAVSPPGVVLSIFRLDPVQQRFRGFSPTAPSFANDYTMVEANLEAVFFCLNASGTLFRPVLGGTASAQPSLVGPLWSWRGTLLNDGQRFTPANPSQYTLQLFEDGLAAAQVDCNRASGSYTVSGNRVTLTFLAVTAAACPPGSLGEPFLRQLNNVTSFFFQDGELFLELMFDSGSMRFTR
jgi:PKD repeat protein